MTRFLPKDRRVRQALIAAVVVAFTVLFCKVLVPGTGGGRGVPQSVFAQSIVLGLVSSLAAVGLIVVYRTVRVINFAQIAFGAIGAQLTFQLVRYVPQVPFVIAVILGVVLAAGAGMLFDLVFGRRFARSPRLVLTVMTIVGAFVLSSQLVGAVRNLPIFPPIATRPLTDFNKAGALHDYMPLRGLAISFHDGGLPFGFPEIFALELTAVALVALAVFFRFSKTGVALRAVAENSDRASLLGISVLGVSTLAWSLAGALGGVSVIGTGFVTTPASAFAFDPKGLLYPLVAAVIARFKSIPVAVFSCTILVVMSQCWSFAVVRDQPLVSAALLVILCVALLAQRRGELRLTQADAAWEAAAEVRPIPAEFKAVTGLRVARWVAVGVFVVIVVSVPWVASNGVTNLGQNIALAAIVAVSLVVLTGWAGQVSLGQYGLVGIGVVVGGGLTATAGVPWFLAVPLTVAITGVLALLIGLPALRIRGLFLGVVTFAFSIAVTDVVFDKRYFGWLIPSSGVARPSAFFVNFNDERSMYYLCVGAFLLSVVVVLNLRKSRLGRLLIALRENESNVQSFGVSLLRTKLMAFVISGGLCGFAGVLFSYQLRSVTADGFRPADSVNVFVYAVIGGVSSVGGVLLGVLFRDLSSYTVGTNNILKLIVGNLPIALLYIAPAGLLAVLIALRDGILRIIAQRRHMVVPSLFADYDAEAIAHRLIPLGEPVTGTGLEALPPTVRYTGRSELYQGHGVRIVDSLKAAKPTAEAAAIAAAGAANAAPGLAHEGSINGTGGQAGTVLLAPALPDGESSDS